MTKDKEFSRNNQENRVEDPERENLRECPECWAISLKGMPGGKDAICYNCGYKDPCCYD